MQDELPYKKEKRKNRALILLLLLLIVGLCIYIIQEKRSVRETKEQVTTELPALAMEERQADYVKPEKPVDRSKNVVLPGWSGFTIQAETKHITQGFEFHNPKENFWYEDWVSINGKMREKLVVDSGNQIRLNHYLKLAGISGSVAKILDCDETCFEISQSEADGYLLAAGGTFSEEKVITLETDAGEMVSLTAECQPQCYYMTFSLYLTEGDELLYESGLVEPGKYLQEMELVRELPEGTYDAYVVCQPYRSDRKTKTNAGIVKISLTAE